MTAMEPARFTTGRRNFTTGRRNTAFAPGPVGGFLQRSWRIHD
jgi:hypothetical protein